MKWDMFENNLAEFLTRVEAPGLSDAGRQLLQDFAALKKTHRQVEKHTRMLYEVTAALSQATTLDEVLSVIVEKGLNPVTPYRGIIGLVSEDRTTLEIVRDFGTQSEVVEQYRRIPMAADTPVNVAVRENRPVWIETPEQYAAEYPEIYRNVQKISGTQAFACIPMAVRQEVIGWLGLGYVTPTSFSTDDRSFLTILAYHCAIAIERARLYDEIQHQSKQIQLKNRELQEFAYTASHDLHEPLRKVQQFAEMLKSSAARRLESKEQDYLNRIQASVSRMQTLIESLLGYSRVATHTEPFQTVNLNSVVQNVLSDLETRIETVHGNVQSDSLPTIEADPVQMRQLFQNLIGNALKFHRPNVPPHVQIRCNQENTVCMITVQDNGIGFESENAERIFLPFQRLHGRSEYEGHGMGLAICRRIVERHHGTISVTSSPGQGATFILTLPLKQPDSGSVQRKSQRYKKSSRSA